MPGVGRALRYKRERVDPIVPPTEQSHQDELAALSDHVRNPQRRRRAAPAAVARVAVRTRREGRQ
eukprot:6193661-Prymnesium_polylepis.1